MRKFIKFVVLSFLVFGLLTNLVITTSSKNSSKFQTQASLNFKEKYGDRWNIKWNEKTSAPEKILGYNIPLESLGYSKKRIKTLSALANEKERKKEIISSTRNFLRENGKLLKVDTIGLKLRKVEYDKPLLKEHEDGTWYVSYEQEYNGIPVYRSGLSLTIINRKIVSISNNFYSDINIPTKPNLTKGGAIKIAREEVNLGGNITPEDTSLVIFPKEFKKSVNYHLAWKIEFPLVREPLSAWVVFIDAHDGEILHKYNNIIFESVSGIVTGMIYPEHPSQNQVEKNFSGLNVTAKQGSSIAGHNVTDKGGFYNITGISGTINISVELKGPWVDVNNEDRVDANHTYNNVSLPGNHSWNWNESDESYKDEESNTFYHVNLVHDFFTSGDPFDITAMNYQMIATVEYGTDTCNAYYSTPNIYLYGPGGGCDSLALYSDVIYHEYTHGVIDHIYDLGTGCYSQGGAMHEGLSDYFASTMNNNSCMAEGWKGGNCLRNLTNSYRYPEDSTGECHDDGRIIGGAAWDLRTYLGKNLTDNLIIRTIKMEGQSFTEFLNDLLTIDDDNADLTDGTPHSTEICQAFSTNHGIRSAYCNFTYTINDSVDYSWIDITSIGRKVNSTESTDGVEGMADDDLTVAIPLGFNFSFYGKNYDHIYIGSNGIVTFISFSVVYFNSDECSVPDVNLPNALIMVYCDDLDPSSATGGGDVYYWQDTNNSRFIIEWYQIPVWNTSNYETMEVILHNDSRIVMQYQSLADNSLDGTIGLENENGTLADLYENASALDLRDPVAIEFSPINHPPSLTNGTVSPLIGNISTIFTYMVTYTDSDNDTPSFINVTIYGSTNSYLMSELNADDKNYIDGKVYFYNTTLNPGNHSFSFMASDGEDINSTEIFQGPNVTAKVVINEVFYNTQGYDDEWIELYNPSNFTISLGGYNISDGEDSYTILFNGVDISPLSYLILAYNATKFNLTWNIPSGIPIVEYGSSAPNLTLSDTGDDLNLTNPEGNEVDYVNYGNIGNDPAPNVSQNHSIERNFPGNDTDNSSRDFLDRENPTPSGGELNIPPILTDGNVTPSSGNTSTIFSYTVTYSDMNNDSPSYIYVTIDNSTFSMNEVNSSDENYTDGKGYYYNTTLSSENHTYNFSASDGRSEFSTETKIGPIQVIDTTPPRIYAISPHNGKAISSRNITFYYNVTDEDSGIISNCSLIINGVVNLTKYNVSEDITENFTINNFSEGRYNWSINCFDNNGNENSSEVWIFFIDIIAPSWSNNITSPSSGVVYSPTANYQFNVTWVDNLQIDKVWFEHNFSGISANYTITGNSSSVYYYNYTNIGAGSYFWRMYANDSAGNLNQTKKFNFSVKKANDELILYFNGNLVEENSTFSIIYGTLINVTAASLSGTENLYRDGIQVNNSEITTLAVGTHQYKVNSTGNANYNGNLTGIAFYIQINKSQAIVNLTLNGNASNITVTFREVVNITAALIQGQGNLLLYEDGNLINNGSSPLSNISSYNEIGYHNITALYQGNQNYSESFKTYWILVTSVVEKQEVGVNATISLLSFANISSVDLPAGYDEYNESVLNNSIVIDVNVNDTTPENNSDSAYLDITLSSGTLNVSTLKVFKVNYGYLPEVSNVSNLPESGGNASFCRECYYNNTITIRLYPGDPRIVLLPPPVTYVFNITLQQGWNLISIPLIFV